MISQREQGVEAVGAEVARSGRAQGRRQWSVGDDEGIGGQRRSFGALPRSGFVQHRHVRKPGHGFLYDSQQLGG